MKKLLIIFLIVVAICLVVPAALGYGFGLAGGDMSATMFSNVADYDVSGDGNYVVGVTGDNADVTSYAKEMPTELEPDSRAAGWAVFFGIVLVLVGGFIYWLFR